MMWQFLFPEISCCCCCLVCLGVFLGGGHMLYYCKKAFYNPPPPKPNCGKLLGLNYQISYSNVTRSCSWIKDSVQITFSFLVDEHWCHISSSFCRIVCPTVSNICFFIIKSLYIYSNKIKFTLYWNFNTGRQKPY